MGRVDAVKRKGLCNCNENRLGRLRAKQGRIVTALRSGGVSCWGDNAKQQNCSEVEESMRGHIVVRSNARAGRVRMVRVRIVNNRRWAKHMG